MQLDIKKSTLTVLSGILLISGSALLIPQIKTAFSGIPPKAESSSLQIAVLQGQLSDLQGAYKVDSVDNIVFRRDGKDAFNFLLAHYQDSQNQERRALLYPKSKAELGVIIEPMAIRQTIWSEAGTTIRRHTEKDAIILSWWDDGQRIHFLSDRDVWVSKPADETFKTPLLQQLQAKFLPASEDDLNRLQQMARWLTMDARLALKAIRETFGSSRPVYLVVTNDLLMRLGELADYGGNRMAFHSATFPAQNNLHADIANIRQWADEHGNGNYLVQKEGTGYRVWTIPMESKSNQQTLLVRLLPFVASLKALPEGVQLVYQSHWGSYLSVYKILPN